jgi:AcrR family transcriptional regulator
MTTEDRRVRERQEVQDRILNAARELFAAEGYEAVTMRRIAEAIEYTPGALYGHFADKRELILALCRGDFQAFDGRMRGLVQGEDDPLRRIWIMGSAYLRFAAERPNHYKLMFMTEVPADVEPTPEDVAAMSDPSRDGFAYLVWNVQEAIARGDLRRELGDPMLVAQTLWAALHGVAALHVTYRTDRCVTLHSMDARGALMQAAIMRGLMADQTRLEEIAEHARRVMASAETQGAAAGQPAGGGGVGA